MKTSDATQLISMCVHDMSRVADMNRQLAHRAGFLCSYLDCQLSLCNVRIDTDLYSLVLLKREVFMQKFATRLWLRCACVHDIVHSGYLQQITCRFSGSSKRPKSIISKQFCCTFKQSKLNTFIVYVYRYSHPWTQLSTF